jgi:effector-binding domain-containing protein
MEEFDTYFTQTSENVTQLTEEFGIETSGSLYAFYYSWDTLAQKSELAIGFAINELPSLPEALDTIRIPRHNAFLSTHIGDYSAIEDVHVAINLHADQRNIALEMPAIEHYVVDHRTEEDSTRWLTEIIYLTKP